jgi:hypothetical protein
MPFFEVNSSFITQHKPDLTTRWFKDEDSDLFVWQEENGGIHSFQLTLQPTIFRDISAEIIVEWTEEKGLRTGKVDNGGGSSRFKGSPVIYMTSNIDEEILDLVTTEFIEKSVVIDQEIKQFILETLNSKRKE